MPYADGLADLANNLDPADALHAVRQTLGSSFDADRIGIAVAVSPDFFEVIAEVTPEGPANKARHRFAAAATAGAWVTANAVPLVAREPADLDDQPPTRDYMLKKNYASACVIPIDLGRVAPHRDAVLYLFSKRRDAFNSAVIPLILRVREIIEPVARAQLAVNDLRHGAPMPEDPAPPVKREPATLETVERNHILRTLEHANWVIEGPRGAAATLGLNPSTLRNRMRKLDIRRGEPIPI